MEDLIEELLRAISEDYSSGKFTPILEADIVGYLYHLSISRLGSASEVHLDTRICGLMGQRFDFVVGGVRSCHADRPCIAKPKLIIEVKSFAIGFTHQQHRVHYRHVIEDDLPKLAELKEPLNRRYILLFDEDDYLKGFDGTRSSSKIKSIVKHRNNLNSKIKIIHVKKVGKTLEWNLL